MRELKMVWKVLHNLDKHNLDKQEIGKIFMFILIIVKKNTSKSLQQQLLI